MASYQDIPKKMRAQVLTTPGGDLIFTSDRPVPSPVSLKPGQCLVKLEYSGVCHSDLGIRKDIYLKRAANNIVGGHEGIGTVVAIAEHSGQEQLRVGQRVGVTFVAYTCLACEPCLKGSENYCRKLITGGYDIDGTFAEYVAVNIHNAIPIPDGLDSAAAASIMCAGITVYSAIKKSDALPGDWVVIPGAGGGLGHLAVQYATALGYRVVAIDSGENKKLASLQLGAERWIDFRETKDLVADVIALTDGEGAHAAIVATDNVLAYQQATQYLRRLGTLVVVGLPAGKADLEIPITLFTGKGISIRGSMIGSRKEFQEALALAATGRVKVKFDVRGLSELPQVYEELSQGRVVGRVVLDISK